MEIANTQKQYTTSNHLTYSCQYHVIFCPKYRRKVLVDGIDVRLKELFLEVAKKDGFEILDMEITPDHVHLLIDCNPKLGIIECLKHLKGGTSKILREEFPSLKTRIPTLWTRNAFISTVGSVSLESINQYLEEQTGK